ncbi:hypothetical protein BJY52DRAFT_1195037 [Lactarius psammicola]|nr:hypothetical protein BJY52DRAFT_1195037 [Lactarius psammicola]
MSTCDEAEHDPSSSEESSDSSQHGLNQSTGQLTEVELRKTLKATQLSFQKLDRKYKALHTKYNALKSAKSASVKKGHKSLPSNNDRETTLAGGRFAFAFELWVDISIFDQERPSRVDPLNHHCYDSPLAEKLAITTELYESLPSHLHGSLVDPRRRSAFAKLFLQQVKQERANMVHTARNVAGEILGIDPTYFRSKYKRANISELGELLRDTRNPEQGYPLWAAVLFPSRDCNSTQPFLVEELVTLLRAILYGVSSLGGQPAGRRMIALAATILTFVCGPDQTFSEKASGLSGVDWRDRFLLYKKTILKLPSDYFSFLFAWYDEQIFGTTADTSASTDPLSTPQHGLKDVDDLIERMTNTNVAHASSLSAAAAVPHRESHSPAPSFQSSVAAVGNDLGQVEDTPEPEQPVPVSVPSTNRRVTRGAARAAASVQTNTRKTRSGATARARAA